MILKFKTKPDKCGNTYYLQIDTDKKTYSTHFFFNATGSITIKSIDMQDLLNKCASSGYTEEY